MMTPLLDDYMTLRRAAGFELRVQEVHLRNFVKFAAERGEAFVRTQTALDWAALAPSASQRGNRTRRGPYLRTFRADRGFTP